jgi:hypothetical protein
MGLLVFVSVNSIFTAAAIDNTIQGLEPGENIANGTDLAPRSAEVIKVWSEFVDTKGVWHPETIAFFKSKDALSQSTSGSLRYIPSFRQVYDLLTTDIVPLFLKFSKYVLKCYNSDNLTAQEYVDRLLTCLGKITPANEDMVSQILDGMDKFGMVNKIPAILVDVLRDNRNFTIVQPGDTEVYVDPKLKAFVEVF